MICIVNVDVSSNNTFLYYGVSLAGALIHPLNMLQSSCKTYASIVWAIRVSLKIFTAVRLLFHVTAVVH